ncbi:hypothetical protein OF83DRAFT_1173316 [Amylostereum chailletii]|nr:hypothetical protein OF83DRAFT_1173316 [Amylostereum chailletii]
MLSFPTPRPPAQIRRASSQYKSSPPPPYAHAFPHMSLTGLDHADVSGSLDGWASEKSREELSDILVRADGLIRERQRELSFTSELSRELHSSNLALKKTHDDLISRLPPSMAGTPLGSPTPTPHLYSSSLPRNNPIHKPCRGRRISVSPGELALLSDQNAELLSKLEQLEEESAQADRLGKRRLSKLESEIQQLQRELEEARARSDALEEHASQLQRGSEEAVRRRQERQEKLKLLRGNPENSQHSRPDFAPASTSLSGSSTSQNLSDFPAASPPSGASFPNAPSISDSVPSDIRERTLISQLLLKVEELEEANMQIGQQQWDTTTKLREAQMEAETIRRLYALLDDNDNVEIQVVEDDEDHDSVPAPSTLRFRSLRRTIGGDVSMSFEGSFEHGIQGDMHSTVRNGVLKHGKTRKSLVGLFDSSVDEAKSSARAVPPDNISEARLRSQEETILSPTLSSLDLSGGDRFASLLATRRPTLGSELGSELGEGWTSPSGNHYHRPSSIYDVLSPSPSPSPCPPERPLSRAKTPSRESPAYTTNPSFTFPVSRSAIPPHIHDDETPTKTGSARSRRLSQTVRSRTHRWVDRRFQDTLQSLRSSTPPPTVEDNDNLVFSPVARAIDRVFDVVDAAVEKLAHAVPPGVLPTDKDSKPPAVARRNSSDDRSTEKSVSKSGRVTALMLEIWLWLQFAVIIFIFLWAMARRGPKSILQDADKRRTRPT